MKAWLTDSKLFFHPLSLIPHPSFPALLQPLTMLIVVFVVAAVALVAFAASSRHKKASSAPLDLVGRTGTVERDLKPEGAVLVRGEMFPARTRTGEKIERADGVRVRVVGTRGHLLEVERAE